MSMLKKSNAALRTPDIGFREWGNRQASAENKDASLDILSRFDPKKWLLSHVSVVASVDVDLANPEDPKTDWLIRPGYDQFVNDNGDSWERKLLINSYNTFLGANNYVEHVQDLALAKGKIVDAAMRQIVIGKDPKTGQELDTLYVDLLIATDRRHEQLCKQIIKREYNAVSMGCVVDFSICTKCGNRAHNEDEACTHILNYKHNYFYDDFGNRRIIAELCGHYDSPGSNTFTETSWVKVPAFNGAALRQVLNPTGLESLSGAVNIGGIVKTEDQLLEYLSTVVVADTKHHQLNKVASAEEVDRFGLTANGDEPTKDLPPEEVSSDGELAMDGGDLDLTGEGADSLADGESIDADFPDDLSEDEDLMEEDTEEDTELSEEAKSSTMEDLVAEASDSMLFSIKKKLLEQIKSLTGDDNYHLMGRGGANPYALETSGNNSLVKAASTEIDSEIGGAIEKVGFLGEDHVTVLVLCSIDSDPGASLSTLGITKEVVLEALESADEVGLLSPQLWAFLALPNEYADGADMLIAATNATGITPRGDVKEALLTIYELTKNIKQ